MNSRSRMKTAFAFKEPDRVPIELEIDPRVQMLPEAQRLVEFIEKEADNFVGGGSIDWGFFGLPGRYRERILDDRPGEHRRIERVWETAAGPFVAITRHSYPHLDSEDFLWEQRFVHKLDDLARLAAAPRRPCAVDLKQGRQGFDEVNTRGLPALGLMHPLGLLVRLGTIEEVYSWFITEKDTVHAFLRAANAQVIATIEEVGRHGFVPWFGVIAHEMLIPPWMGMRQFDEWVYPYDKSVNGAVHGIGGRVRAHCHGNCMGFLEHMSEMGVDAIEPLEPPPFGDVDLAEAKRRVGHRMVLSGNIPSQDFVRLDQEDVRQLVRQAIADAGAGGGFSLHTTGGYAGVDADLERPVLRKVISNVEAYVQAGLEYGQYPLHV